MLQTKAKAIVALVLGFSAPISKAVAGGLVAAVVAVLARYGFHPEATTVTALGVLVTAVVSYAAGHLLVYLSPANKNKS